MKTLFVTGGAGYVGSHCCKAFAEAGWQVVTYDNLSKGWREMVRWGPLVVGDILDRPALEAALAEAKPDMVAHFAALSAVGESVENPAIYYRNNVTGTQTILEAMRGAGRRQDHLLLHGRHLWRAAGNAHSGDSPPTSDQSLRLVEAVRGADAGRLRLRLWACASWRCGTSTPPAPTRRPRSARSTSPRPT